jgi:cell wall-associated NlpC family hydrolase
MKNLFFVSVAVGIFSGTSLTGIAQTSMNSMKVSDGVSAPATKTPQFIEGIEIKRDVNTVAIPAAYVAPVKAAPIPASTTVVKTNIGTEFSTTIEKCSSLQFKYAQLMNREVEAISNFALYNFIEEWWATRYRYGGTTKNGVDCSALTGALNREVYGINLPRTARDQYAACEKIDLEDLKEGDLVFFNTRGGISHVGVYLGDNYFVHSSVHSGVTISSLEESYYSKKFLGGGRFILPSTIASN